MDFDYEKEEKDFLTALKSGEYKTERITNKGADFKEIEERDLTAFDDYLRSSSFMAFAEEVSK
jgi:hypothetical protein